MITSNIDEIINDAPLYKLAVELSDLAGGIADDYYYLNDAIQDTDTDLIGYPIIAKLGNLDRLDLIIKIAEQAKLRIREAQ